jgi:hypothetical protein
MTWTYAAFRSTWIDRLSDLPVGERVHRHCRDARLMMECAAINPEARRFDWLDDAAYGHARLAMEYIGSRTVSGDSSL